MLLGQTLYQQLYARSHSHVYIYIFRLFFSALHNNLDLIRFAYMNISNWEEITLKTFFLSIDMNYLFSCLLLPWFFL